MTEEKVQAGWSEAQADCRHLFEENSHPMLVVALMDVVEVNRAAVLHYGYSRDEFLAMTMGDLEAAEEPEKEITASPRAVGRHRRKDRSLIYVEVSSFAVTFGGRPALLTSVVDVTHRWTTDAETRCLELMLEFVTHASQPEATIRALLNNALAAQEAERRRIARELQAETAQSLASLLVGLKTVEASQDLGQAKGAASTVRGLVSAALNGVQCLTRGLGPSPRRIPPTRR
jgi:PAS domain S-box-containing protein